MAPASVKLSDLKVSVPAALAAQHPLPKRENARLLIADRSSGELRDEKFKNLPKYFQKGDVLVLNDTKAFPSHLVGTKEKGDTRIDVYLVRELQREERLWDIVVEPARKVRIGNRVYFDGGRVYCEIIENTTTRGRIARFSYEGDMTPLINRIGQMALPPYIIREHTDEDRERFQTVFANPSKRYAIAPPTAGLHFTKDMLKAIAKQGVHIVFVTLHIGQCVLEPIELEDVSKYRMYSEYFDVSREVAETINKALKSQRNVYVVGSSTLRALESSVLTTNMLKPNRGWTDKYIFPPYDFKFKFRLLTNFHPSNSTSLVLAGAVAGPELLVRSYRHAVKEGYRFFRLWRCNADYLKHCAMRIRPLKVLTVASVLPDELAFLERLAYNFWWSWNRKAESVFSTIDPVRWEKIRRNPIRLLKETPQERFRELSADSAYRRLLSEVETEFEAYLNQPPRSSWSFGGPIAYFCAEYGISECFQNYSGGLGVLAGDHLKTASDVGLPMVAVGLLYQQGYFHQHVTYNGWQQENFLDYDFSLLPIQLVRTTGGEPLIIHVELPDGDVAAQVWKADVGRVPLYLLDTNIADNSANPTYQNITDQLYGGTHETRIMQEMLLGIGGVRMLAALGIEPSVIHVNEGHAAFCTLERTRLVAQRLGLQFDEAAEITRAQTCFTTHTPVPAGNEIFSLGLLQQYFSRYAPLLGIEWEELLKLGQGNNGSSDEGFSMTILGLRMSNHRNGVSELHGHVARTMWQSLWPHVSSHEVPIRSITNGVHIPTWVSSDFAALYDRALGSRWRQRPSEPTQWEVVATLPDAELWAVHVRRRQRLLESVREHIRQRSGYYDEEHRQRVITALHPNCLIIGFARRFATYKRSDLLFRNWDRLASILRNPSRPVIILLAGKAHPQDIASKEMMQRILTGIRNAGLEQHVIFLEDYDLGIARALVKGPDMWLNTPRRPYEASGTSGMKAALNGVLHCSVLDGWWAEAAGSDNGFTIGHGETFATADEQDAHESESLYQLLENDIIPMFYERDAAGIPRRWVKRMKSAIVTLAARYSTDRMLDEYRLAFYEPAASLGATLGEQQGRAARDLSRWKRTLPERWKTLHIISVDIPDRGFIHVGEPVPVRLVLDCGAMNPDELLAQVYYGPLTAHGEFLQARVANLALSHVEGGRATFEGTYTTSDSGQHGVAVRVLPRHQHVPDPVDLHLVVWVQGEQQ